MSLSPYALKGRPSARSEGSRQTAFARHDVIKKLGGWDCVAKTYSVVTLVTSGSTTDMNR